jgi:heptosyltransferase-3
MGFLREERRAKGRAIVRASRRLRDAVLRPPPLPRPEGLPRRILVIRPYFLGDIVLCLPVAQALRRARPDARISWLCRSEWIPLLQGHTPVDEVIPFPDRGAKEWFGFLQGLRGRFDLVLSLAWDRSTPWIARATGAPTLIAIEEHGRPRISSLLHTHTVVAPERTRDRRPMADFYFEPLRLLGFGARGEEPKLVPTLEEDREVGERLASGLGMEEGFLLVHPGGRLRAKRWSPERFAEVLRKLTEACRAGAPPATQADDGNRSGCPTADPYAAKRSGCPPVVLVCGPGEESWAANLARDLPPGRGMFWPVPKLGELIALSKRARIFLGNDSGPMHVAAAAGCRVVAVFGGDPCRWGPCGEGHRVVTGPSGIESIPASRVSAALREALAT